MVKTTFFLMKLRFSMITWWPATTGLQPEKSPLLLLTSALLFAGQSKVGFWMFFLFEEISTGKVASMCWTVRTKNGWSILGLKKPAGKSVWENQFLGCQRFLASKNVVLMLICHAKMCVGRFLMSWFRIANFIAWQPLKNLHLTCWNFPNPSKKISQR